mmetsp:Transcript_16962/g.48478  ORF Transcript_16962/g.48478 Transcript_16962/m.48478 type:complete len:549 (-) Transcript_16962:3-1649(-)
MDAAEERVAVADAVGDGVEADGEVVGVGAGLRPRHRPPRPGHLIPQLHVRAGVEHLGHRPQRREGSHQGAQLIAPGAALLADRLDGLHRREEGAELEVPRKDMPDVGRDEGAAEEGPQGFVHELRVGEVHLLLHHLRPHSLGALGERVVHTRPQEVGRDGVVAQHRFAQGPLQSHVLALGGRGPAHLRPEPRPSHDKDRDADGKERGFRRLRQHEVHVHSDPAQDLQSRERRRVAADDRRGLVGHGVLEELGLDLGLGVLREVQVLSEQVLLQVHPRLPDDVHPRPQLMTQMQEAIGYEEDGAHDVGRLQPCGKQQPVLRAVGIAHDVDEVRLRVNHDQDVRILQLVNHACCEGGCADARRAVVPCDVGPKQGEAVHICHVQPTKRGVGEIVRIDDLHAGKVQIGPQDAVGRRLQAELELERRSPQLAGQKWDLDQLQILVGRKGDLPRASHECLADLGRAPFGVVSHRRGLAQVPEPLDACDDLPVALLAVEYGDLELHNGRAGKTVAETGSKRQPGLHIEQRLGRAIACSIIRTCHHAARRHANAA